MTEFPGPKDVMFFAAIGRLAVAWGHLETALDIMVDITLHIGGRHIEPERPRALKRKIEYLKRFFKSLNMPDNGMQNYSRLFNDISRQSDFRHDMIHGAIIDHSANSGEADLTRFLYKKESITLKPVKVNTDEIMDAAQEAERLGNRLFKWVEAFSEFARKQNPQGEKQTR